MLLKPVNKNNSDQLPNRPNAIRQITADSNHYMQFLKFYMRIKFQLIN